MFHMREKIFLIPFRRRRIRKLLATGRCSKVSRHSSCSASHLGGLSDPFRFLCVKAGGAVMEWNPSCESVGTL